jgi:bifunctional non-homologous end joining protein LigD
MLACSAVVYETLVPGFARIDTRVVDTFVRCEQWVYELELDGYRAAAFKRNGAVQLRSRNDNDFNAAIPAVVQALAKSADEHSVRSSLGHRA